MNTNGEQPAYIDIDPRAGSLGQLQQAEARIGFPVERWKEANRSDVLVACLIVYAGWTEEEALAAPFQETAKRVRVGEAANP